MTVKYLDKITNGSTQFFFVKLLFAWKGSLYKLVWVDLIGYLGLYYLLNLTYRFALNSGQQKSFEEVVKFCDSMKNNIPISFLLGFFVTGVIARWFQMYLFIPRLNKMAFLIEGMVNGNDRDVCRKLRQTVMRYLNLSWILCLREVSDQIEKRFKKPNILKNEEYGVRDTFTNFNRDEKIRATYRKIITEPEIRAFENVEAKNYSRNKTKYVPEFWIPIQWTSRLLQKAYVHGHISDPKTVNSLISDLESLRGQMHILQIFSGIMIPLVYTQVIIIAVYSYFLCQIFASQFLNPNSKIKEHEVDLYVPIFTIFQFLFFMGWLKVAMCVMNPFGEDDEDFQTSEILNDNLDVTLRSVTGDMSMYPEHLDAPDMTYKPLPKSEEDFLMMFMNDMDGDLETIEELDVDGDVTALEVKPSRWRTFMRIINKCNTPCKPKSMEQGEELTERQSDHLVESV